MKRARGSRTAAADATSSIEDIERSIAVSSAQNSFIAEALNLGWRLAICVIVPLFIGVKLDDHFKTSPSYTLVSLFIAIFLGGMTIYKTSKDVTRRQNSKQVKRKKRHA